MTNLIPVELRRDCPATTVPYGEQVELTQGGLVTIVQRLGGSVTVRTPMGSLLRIDGEDLDALGLSPTVDTPAKNGPFSLDHVTAALHTVFDPEIPVSIVELGLVYRCEEVLTSDGRRIEIDMTMTAPGCGMGDVLRDDVLRAVGALSGVDTVEVTLVWDPPWNLDFISPAARLQLGLL